MCLIKNEEKIDEPFIEQFEEPEINQASKPEEIKK